MTDPYDLERFVTAQRDVYGRVLAELRAGQKESHWMWFIFPQMRGLGRTSTSIRFGVGSLKEAEAYARHPLLGERLRECTSLVNRIEGKSVARIFGYPDDLKFHSSITLFARAGSEECQAALTKYFAGEEDPLTQHLLQ